MIKKQNALLLIGFFFIVFVKAQEFKTYTYFMNDTLKLDLDLFVPYNETPLKTPLVIYVHGGGFSNGDRTAGHNFAKYLAKQNIACASISYSLYMKDKSFGCDGKLVEKIKAIQIASNQLWLATAYLIDQSNLIHIDKSKIFIAGSSAGAETVLHAAFWNRSMMQLYKEKLIPEFKYKGVIAGSGAIMDLNLITQNNKIPLMLFHGDADLLVPYDTASHHFCPPNSPGWLMLFGSYSIAQHIQSINGTCQITTFKGGGHSYAGEYFHQSQQHVVDFINRVLSGKKFIKYQTVETKKNN